jgi:HK97 family phage major capsid protein
MSSLAQRISDLQVSLVAKRDALEAHLGNIDDSNVSDSDIETTNTLNSEIAQLEKTHAALVEAEKRLAKTADDGGGKGNGRGRSMIPFTPTKDNSGGGEGPIVFTRRNGKDLDLVELLVRGGTVAYHARVWNKSPEEVRQKIYGDDEQTKVICDLVVRAASAPAMTSVAGWAAELAQTIYTDLMPLLMPKSIFVRLSGKGLTLNFGRAGKINIPTRSRTPTIAGSFVGEGQPIPVRMGAFTSQTLVPKKMAVISTWTREMSDHSIPAIEGLIREAIQQDTSVATDSVLIDANPATTIRPAGLLNGVAALTASNLGAGQGLANLIADIKALVGALTTNTYGNVRTPVWLVNPTDMLSAGLATATNTGIFPFKQEVAAGTLANIPFIDSATVPARTIILVDAADFVSVGGDAPRFEISDQATLHMEDSTPLELVGTGTPGTVASPQRSLFQTDSLALRMILPMNWLQRRTGTVAWMQTVNW